MSEAAVEPPLLALDRGEVQRWAGALMAASELLRLRREQLGRLAWSDTEQAARKHDLLELTAAADPSVRRMSVAETQDWVNTSPEPTYERRNDTHHTDELTVHVGPLTNGRWALLAEVRPQADEDEPDKASVALSCESESLARELADELIARGPDRAELDRLSRYAHQLEARHAAAASAVRETEEHRLARTAAAVREAWQPQLAKQVTENRAFGALAHRLHQLEERGYTLPDILRRIPQDELLGSGVRNPCALAEWYVEGLVDTLVVIDGEVSPDVTEAASTSNARARYQSEGTDAETYDATEESEAEQHRWIAEQRAKVEAEVLPALRRALPDQVCATVRESKSGAYDRLLNNLAHLTSTGWSLEDLLTNLPSERIARADNPASYLTAVVSKKAAQIGPPRTGVDRAAMESLVRDAFPHEIADKLIDCKAWPALAKRVNQAQKDDLPIERMLARLPMESISKARKPAAYASTELQRRINARQATAQPSAHHQRAPHRPDRPGKRLDPKSAIDRIGIAATAGPDLTRAAELVVSSQFGSISMLHRKMRLSRFDEASLLMDQLELRGVVAPAEGTTIRDVLIKPAQLTELLNSLQADVAAHMQASAEATGQADVTERAAGYEHSAAENTTPEHVGPGLAAEAEGLDSQDAARTDDNLAAGYRATAAEELGAAAAAALRAEVTLTPPDIRVRTDSPAANTATVDQVSNAVPVRARRNNPNTDRSRKR
jgi:Ftsk gamma domain